MNTYYEKSSRLERDGILLPFIPLFRFLYYEKSNSYIYDNARVPFLQALK